MRKNTKVDNNTRQAVFVALAVVMAVALTGCHEISIDYQTRHVSGEARSEITPTTMVVGGAEVPAIDIALRYCDTIQVTDAPFEDGPGIVHFTDARPTAYIKDANGTTVFNSFQMWNTYPGDAQAIDNDDPEVTDHLLVPVASFQAPLTITTGCTTYAGHGSLPSVAFYFDPCTTSDRTCAPITTGSASQSPSNWLWDESGS